MQLYEAAGARTGVMLVHGVMSHGGWFVDLAQRLVARGVTVMTIDRTGSGRARERAGGNDPELLVDEAVAGLALLRQKVDHACVVGWCWGARLATLAAARGAASGLLFLAPGLITSPMVAARWKVSITTPGELLPHPFDAEDFSDDPRIVEHIRKDPLAWPGQPRAFTGASDWLKEEALRILPTLTLPIATLLASEDKIVDNARLTQLLGKWPLETLDGGHAIVMEQPDRVADFIVRSASPPR